MGLLREFYSRGNPNAPVPHRKVVARDDGSREDCGGGRDEM